MRLIEVICGAVSGVFGLLAIISLLVLPIATNELREGSITTASRTTFIEQFGIGASLAILLLFCLLISGVVIGALLYGIGGISAGRALLIASAGLLAVAAWVSMVHITPAFLPSALLAIAAAVLSVLSDDGHAAVAS